MSLGRRKQISSQLLLQLSCIFLGNIWCCLHLGPGHVLRSDPASIFIHLNIPLM